MNEKSTTNRRTQRKPMYYGIGGTIVIVLVVLFLLGRF
jgi:hypothetical protein